MDFDGLIVLVNDFIKDSLLRFNYEIFWFNGSLMFILVEFKKVEGMGNVIYDVWSKMVDFELEVFDVVFGDFDVVNDFFNMGCYWWKRVVFGLDEWIKVCYVDLRWFLYFVVVRIFIGCIGIFILEYYVLIVVYCVYDGMNYFVDVKYLKVFVLRY